MTNEEAYKGETNIKISKPTGITFYDELQEGDRAISLKTVIKAVDEHTLDDGTLDDDISCILEDLPSITLDLTPCDDAVSRETILNKIKEVCFSKDWVKFRIENGSNGQRDYLFNFIKQLPSVNSQSIYEERKESVRIMQDELNAISRILNRMWNCRGKHTTSIDKIKMEQIIRDELSPVKPQDCDQCEVGNPCLYCEYEFKAKADDPYQTDMDDAWEQAKAKYSLCNRCTKQPNCDDGKRNLYMNECTRFVDVVDMP